MRLLEGQRGINRIKPLVKVLFPSVVFALSVIAVSEYGSILLFVWITLSITLAFLAFTEVGSGLLNSPGDEGKEQEAQKHSMGDNQLREFVYLNSLSVQSLLASLNIAITEETREVSQEIEQMSLQTGMKAGSGTTGAGSLSVNASLLNTETGNEILETTKRINDQYRFNQLKNELDRHEKVSSLPEDWENSASDYNYDLDGIGVVEVEGTAKTDPLYRMINVASLFSRINSFDINSETITEVREGMYGEQLGLEISNNDEVSYVMSLQNKNLWTDDPRREFSGSRRYTVLGRVVGVIGEEDEWDYIDLLRVSNTVLDKESMASIRGTIDDFVDLIDSFETDVPLPNLEGIDVEDLQAGREPPTSESTLQLNVKDKRISVEGPAIVIEPIAIYW
ncbi:hypothetical protein KI372_01705 [Halobacterium salinarum]|uniref:DUF6414 family protein n=1 Tax=Halobacterium salinarum TaxID=2242 RepID=UPI001F3A2CAE|nr:hypothetical protein [Halobacterium salinarum]MCF2206864.1 hypothetical protein [Halobacterium salinarum]MCF2240168.1 hypothetical protein [Halobacterium salinarum]